VGDASCCILPDGELIIGALLTGDTQIYNPTTNSWSPGGVKAVRSNEETWVLLPDKTILTVQCFAPFGGEKFIISSNLWKTEGSPPVTLVDPVMHEIGPAMLMYNGHVIYFGAANDNGHGKTALYAPPASPTGTGVWRAGPDIPKVNNQTIVCNDCPASLLPNGKVLFTAANFVNNGWGQPILFFEYDPNTNTISQAPTPPNNNNVLFLSRLMLLPTGQVLFSAFSNNIQCYTPDGGPENAWRPTIFGIPWRISNTEWLLYGTQLNGLSQANIYGDDCYPATNYPLIRLRQSLPPNKVYFARTYNFSTMGVATGPSLQHFNFSVRNIPYGHYELCVIANGISSYCVPFHYRRLILGRPATEPTADAEETLLSVEEDVVAESATIAELRTQIKGLQNSIRRIEAITKLEEPKPAPKEITQEETGKGKSGREK